jgi:hypothetical protein
VRKRTTDTDDLGSNPAELLSWPGGVVMPAEFERFRRTKAEDDAHAHAAQLHREERARKKAKLHRHLSELGHNTTPPYGCHCGAEHGDDDDPDRAGLGRTGARGTVDDHARN